MRSVACRVIWLLLLTCSSPLKAEEDIPQTDALIRMGYDVARRYCEKPGMPWEETADDGVCKNAKSEGSPFPPTPMALGYYFRQWFGFALAAETYRKRIETGCRSEAGPEGSVEQTCESTSKNQTTGEPEKVGAVLQEFAKLYEREADNRYHLMQIIQHEYERINISSPAFDEFCEITQSDCVRDQKLLEKQRKRLGD